MVYKGHLYKGHSQLFQNYKGQGIGTPKKFRDNFLSVTARAIVVNMREEFNFNHNMHVQQFCRLVNYVLM